MNKRITFVTICILLILSTSLRYASDDDVPRPKSQLSHIEIENI